MDNSAENTSTVSTHEPEAKIKASKSLSAIWLVPLIALAIGLWMVYQQWANQGPLINITFNSAAGIEIKKTKLKTREVTIGEVTAISLLQDSEGVNISVRVNKEARNLLNQDSKFWVVSPKVTHAGISGLNTLLSGSYIEMSPGQSEQEQYNFEGLDEPPVTPYGTPGLHITLNSNAEFAYQAGDPIIYKGLTVGRVEDIFFNFYERVVYYNAFIKDPYHKLITANTRFWNASGVKVDLTSEGISLQTGNLETMLTNGITFGIPDGEIPGEVVTDRAYFDIYPNYEDAVTPNYKHSAKYVILVSDTVRGLKVGAPVEYRGLEIGEVLAINVQAPETSSLLENDYKIPVLISIEPGKVGLPDNQQGLEQVMAQNEIWVNQGLRARLQTGNLLTGQLFVELQHYPDLPELAMTRFLEYPVIPTTLDDFSQLTQKASDVLDKLNRLPVEDLMSELTVMAQDFRETAAEFKAASAGMDELLINLEEKQVLEQVNKTMASFEQLAQSYSIGSQGHDELIDTISTLNQRMSELQPLLLQLNQQPSSIIFSAEPTQAKEPKAKSQ